MSVEIAYWRTRCNRCGEVHGVPWADRWEAEAYDRGVGGMCALCSVETKQATRQPTAPEVKP